MEKKNKVFIIILAIIAIIALSVLLAINKKNKDNKIAPPDINTSSENVGEVIGEEDAVDNSAVTPGEISVPADLDWRDSIKATDFQVEFMTDDEKAKIGIAQEKRVQVISRDDLSGMILAYKVIENDSDIVTGSQE